MGLFSFAEKTKQDTVSNDSEFYSHAEEEAPTVRRRSRRKPNQDGSDPMLPEKKRARRRLVGAVALVLAAIIGLPMILDSEPKPLNSDIAIEIPSKDKPSAQAQDKEANPASLAALPPAASLDQNEEIIEPPVRDSAAASTAPSRQDNTVKTTPTEAEPTPRLQARALPNTEEKSVEEARARALLEGQPDPKADAGKKSADGKNGKFIVQVAALGSQDKVNELQNKLKSAGIKSYTNKVATQSGERIRVRVGPFSSKEDAEKIRAKLVKLGLGGTLVPV